MDILGVKRTSLFFQSFFKRFVCKIVANLVVIQSHFPERGDG